MTVRITHAKVSGKAAGSDPDRVYGTHWDADHTVTGLTIGTDIQAHDTTLDALAAYNMAGLLTQTAADTFTGRTIAGTANQITLTNGNGVSGNPTISLPSAVTLPGSFLTTTFGNITTYLNVGSASAPANTTAGDLTAARGFFSGDITANGAPLGTPNLCLNPGMQVWQNDTTIAAVAHRGVLADGWLWGAANGSAAFTCSRDTDVPDSDVPYSIKVECTTADGSPGSSVDRHIRYAIYGYDLQPWASSNLVVKFWVKSSKTGTYCVVGINEARDKCYIVEYTINAANTWEEKSVTIPMGSKSGTWNTGAGFGIGIRFTLVATSPITASAGSWQSGNYVGTSNQVNFGDSTSNVFRITKVQICPESCPKFNLPSYDTALTNAQRQYRVIDTDVNGVNVGIGFAITTDSVNFDILLPFPMYAPPTISYKGTLDTDLYFQAVIGPTQITGATFTSFARSKNIAKFSLNKTGAYTAGASHYLRLQTTSGKLVIDGHLA